MTNTKSTKAKNNDKYTVAAGMTLKTNIQKSEQKCYVNSSLNILNK